MASEKLEALQREVARLQCEEAEVTKILDASQQIYGRLDRAEPGSLEARKAGQQTTSDFEKWIAKRREHERAVKAMLDYAWREAIGEV